MAKGQEDSRAAAGTRVLAALVPLRQTVRDGDHLGIEATDEAETDDWGPGPRQFHSMQFLSTVIRLVRKDSHV
ncbi:hypothetical protein ACFWBN_26830 [Streptomyces sp. NPDC059989]|uniref:hypothetical protein n=1 Tax=Streptomyces sp. NPDC059989 TaxID=3347026 RepID=UPI0036BC2AB3